MFFWLKNDFITQGNVHKYIQIEVIFDIKT